MIRSTGNRTAIVRACGRYCAFNPVPALDVKRDLEWLDKRFADLIEWWASDPPTSFAERHAITRVMQRAFPMSPSSRHPTDSELPDSPLCDPRGLREFFNKMVAVRGEIAAELKAVIKDVVRESKGLSYAEQSKAAPLVELEPSAWDHWVQSVADAAREDGFEVTARADEEAKYKPSRFVRLVSELQAYLPKELRKHNSDLKTLATAIRRAGIKNSD